MNEKPGYVYIDPFPNKQGLWIGKQKPEESDFGEVKCFSIAFTEMSRIKYNIARNNWLFSLIQAKNAEKLKLTDSWVYFNKGGFCKGYLESGQQVLHIDGEITKII